MLIGDRKFDVRVLVLVTANMEIYILKEGYLRLSGKSYSLDDNDLSNKYIHLTNNAVQKNCAEYCMFESGNQMNFDEFQEYLDSKNLKCSVKDTLFKKMKNIVSIVISSAKRKINCNRRKWCFEIIGFDFMIDNQYNVWLIEANSNPCIEESSQFLKALIPRMIDDAFKLTIDKLFPKPYTCEEPSTHFRVPGYTNTENLWEYIHTNKRMTPTGIGVTLSKDPAGQAKLDLATTPKGESSGKEN